MSFAEPINQPRSNGERAQYGNDSGLFVKFYKEPVYLEAKSKKDGKEHWEDRTFVHIAQPGAKSDFIREVILEPRGDIPADPVRFPHQWAAFQAQNEQVQSGLPLEQCAFISKARVLEFKAANIHTCEQLGAIPDSVCQTLGMGARQLRDQAKAYLDDADRMAALKQRDATIDNLNNELEVMKKQLADIAAAQNGVTPARGQGRASKEKEHAA